MNKYLSLLFIISLLGISCTNNQSQNRQNKLSEWELAKQIEDSLRMPVFPKAIFNVLDFGAVPDGKTNNSEAFKKAIKQCTENGGGKVLVPAGSYLCGPIHLENNVNLHLDEGAEILFSTNTADYYPLVHTSYEGLELMNYSPLIYAHQKKNIAVTGNGILNGQASNEFWWKWSGKDTYGWEKGSPSQRDSLNLPLLMELSEKDIPIAERIFGDGHYLRPSFFEPLECEDVLLQGVKIVNAPFWVIHPSKCTNVIIDGVTVESHGPNNDGCDPEYSKNVIIKNCTFNTGDDCIAIKSGRDAEGRRVAIKSENIIVKGCNMIDGHGGVVIGSEMSAGVQNVFVEDCKMNSPNLDRAIRIKSNSRRGGTVDGVYVRNVEIGQVKEAVLKVNMFYATYSNQTGEFIPEVRNIVMEDIRVKNGGYYGILAKGYAELPIKNITLNNVIIEQVDKPFSLENVENLRLIDTYINGELMESPQ